MKHTLRVRRLIAVLVGAAIMGGIVWFAPDLWHTHVSPVQPSGQGLVPQSQAVEVLETLEVKGRAPKTGYVRSQFGSGWSDGLLCDTRNAILRRDLTNSIVDEDCRVLSGELHDPYTGNVVLFRRGESTSAEVQIDHVVALSNAWQTGAQALSEVSRRQFANDPLNLLAVDGDTNMKKGDGDAATWLPPSRGFRCQYVARQILVKSTYALWVTAAEKDAMLRVLQACPGQTVPGR